MLRQRERDHHRFLRRHRCTDHVVEQIGEQRVVAVDADAARPTDARSDTPTGNPVTVRFRLLSDLLTEVQRLAQIHAVDARRHHRRHRRRTGNPQRGVVSDLAGLHHGANKALRIGDIRRDADRCNAHRCTIGGAVTPGLFRRVAGEDHFDRAFGRRAEQILRALGLHRGFPFDQTLREDGRFDVAVAFDQQFADQNRLFGVIGDRAFRHVRGDRLQWPGILQIGDLAEARLDGFAVQRLRRHAQRVAEGQAIKSTEGTVERGHFDSPNCRCRRKCTGSSRLSTSSIKRFCRS